MLVGLSQGIADLFAEAVAVAAIFRLATDDVAGDAVGHQICRVLVIALLHGAGDVVTGVFTKGDHAVCRHCMRPTRHNRRHRF